MDIGGERLVWVDWWRWKIFRKSSMWGYPERVDGDCVGVVGEKGCLGTRYGRERKALIITCN
jgi:hypothetical protein